MPDKIKKYIVFDDEFAIRFPMEESHVNIALRRLAKPVSAGFIRPAGGGADGYVCYGESLTLHLKSRPEDAKYFQKK